MVSSSIPTGPTSFLIHFNGLEKLWAGRVFSLDASAATVADPNDPGVHNKCPPLAAVPLYPISYAWQMVGQPTGSKSALNNPAAAVPNRVAASVVEGAYSLSGTTGLFESCPLQRRLRDVRAVTQHYMLSARSAFGPVGTALLSEETAG